jgi:hypothetical protein
MTEWVKRKVIHVVPARKGGPVLVLECGHTRRHRADHRHFRCWRCTRRHPAVPIDEAIRHAHELAKTEEIRAEWDNGLLRCGRCHRRLRFAAVGKEPMKRKRHTRTGNKRRLMAYCQCGAVVPIHRGT